MNPTWRYYFCLFHSHDPKTKRNHQIASSRAKTRSRRSQACLKYRGIIVCIKRYTYVNTSDLKILHKKMSKVDFLDVIINFSKLYMVCLQANTWLESYDHYGSFGTMICGSLIVSPVLWILSWGNTLSVTHSDTASYQKRSQCHYNPMLFNNATKFYNLNTFNKENYFQKSDCLVFQIYLLYKPKCSYLLDCLTNVWTCWMSWY